MIKTKNQLVAKIKEHNSLLSAAVMGLGVGLIITVIFTKIGVVLVLVALMIKSFGYPMSSTIPKLIKYRPVTCPFCRDISQVRINASEFTCDNCGNRLAVAENGKVRLYKHLKLAVDNSPTVFGKPVIKAPFNSGVEV